MKKIIALLLVLLTVFSVSACSGTSSSSGKSKQENFGLYIKDSEFFYSDLKADSSPQEVTSRLVDDEKRKKEDLAYYGSVLAAYTYVSADGSLIFFPDKVIRRLIMFSRSPFP